jgi:hypothetical protein
MVKKCQKNGQKMSKNVKKMVKKWSKNGQKMSKKWSIFQRIIDKHVCLQGKILVEKINEIGTVG